MSFSDSVNSTPLKPKRSLDPSSESPVSRTPEKQASKLPSRACNRGVALSIKEMRPVAQTQHECPTDQIKSPRKQILSRASECPPSTTSGDIPDKLPEKYEILCKFFNSLDSAIRLLKLKGSVPTFTNISPKIECLTDRRFSYGHLAQLKHILPEAIEIKRILIFDETTGFMRPDLHIRIIVDAIDCGDESKSDSKNLQLRRVFRARLADFLKAHPEGDEIPEGDLPEPFNHSKQNVQFDLIKGCIPWSSHESSTNTLTQHQPSTAEGEAIQEEARPQISNDSNSNSKPVVKTLAAAVYDQQPVVASHASPSMNTLTQHQPSTAEGEAIQEEARPQISNDSNSNSKPVVKTLAAAVYDEQPVVASHASPSFKKRFSLKVTSKDQVAVQKCLEASLQSSIFQVAELCADKFTFSDKTSSAPAQSPTKFLSKPTMTETSPETCLPATPVKEINPSKFEEQSHIKAGCIESTPAKLASTPARLMITTPSLKPDKRCYMSPDEVSSSSLNKLVRRPLRTRSLKFDTSVKEEKVVDEVHEMTGKPVNIDKDVLSMLPESLLNSIAEKEAKAMEEQDPAISQAKRQQHVITCLPKLFNMIHYLFQSIKRTVITKEELMHKIIVSHLDIVDRGEVEEQLKLLLELAPEWISEKMASTGDLLVCINKVSSPESIRMRLQEEK